MCSTVKSSLLFICCTSIASSLAACASSSPDSSRTPGPAVSAVSKSAESSVGVQIGPPQPPAEDPDAVYQMRQMHLSEWIDKAKRDCERTKNTDAYLPERDGFPPDEIELVKKRCAEAVEVAMRGTAWRRAMSACADRFVQAKGKGTHECRLTPKDVPDLPPEWFERHKAACSESCAEAGLERMELIKERAQFVRCCDGTTSPSCTYGSLRPNCCAGHQGICIPD